MTRDDDSKFIEDRSETLEDLLEALGVVSLPEDWLEPGAVLASRYRLEELVGRGAGASVFRATDLTLEDVVGLKLLAARTSRHALRQIHEQVKLSRRVTHPNVARIHDVGEHATRHFVTMEFVEGESLQGMLGREKTLSARRSAGIGAQIAAGLEAAHSVGVLHRGLKPSNVIVDPEGRAVVTDFGISRVLQTEAIQDADDVIGAPLYLAPEQFAGEREDEQSDIYALGLLLYEMLTGGLPFPHGGFEEAGAVRMRWPAPDPRRGHAVPDELADIALSCLAIEPAGRPSSAGRVREALERALGGQQAVAQAPRRSSPVSTPPAEQLASSRTLAVLPIVYRGPVEHISLGSGVTEALVDILSRTRSLRVLAQNVTARFRTDRDTGAIREALGKEVDVVVDGTIQLSGSRVQAAVRLWALSSGLQLWSTTFEDEFQELLALQQSMGARMAEALRIEFQAAAHRDWVPPRAMELFVEARHRLRSRVETELEPVVEMLSRCLEMVPGFQPAMAAHALACARATWAMGEEAERLGKRAAESVARAHFEAPDLAETYIAMAVYAAERRAWRDAVESLAVALEMAPTCSDAHQVLGALQVSAGRAREGLRRLRAALELDGTLHRARLHLARHAALHGDRPTFEAHMVALLADNDARQLPILECRMRAALYFGDLDELARRVEQAEQVEGPLAVLACQLGRYILGDLDEEAFDALSKYAVDLVSNARMRLLIDQMLTEAHAHRGATEQALATLRRAAEGDLIDVEWLRHCPALDPLRERGELDACLETVEERARRIWVR